MIYLPLESSTTPYRDINKDLVEVDKTDKDRFRYHNFPLQDNLLREPVSSKIGKANLLLNHFKRVSLQQPKRREKSTLPRSLKASFLNLSFESRNNSVQHDRSLEQLRMSTGSLGHNMMILGSSNANSFD